MYANFLKTCVLLAAVVAAFVGCGGSDETTSLTKAQFIKQADAICKKADLVQVKNIKRLEDEKKMEDRPPAEQNELVTTVGLDPMLKEAEEIGGLPAPEGDEAQIEALVEAIEAGVERARKEPAEFVAYGAPDFFEKADNIAKKYGMKECSEVV